MFLRKRDPRYKAHVALQAKSAEQASSTPASGTATPKKSAPTSAFVAQDWQKVAEPSDSAADLEWACAEGAEDEEWECVACNKTFRSEAAWNSHERSKKHLRAVEQLKREMQNEELELDLGGQDGDGFADADVKNQDQECDDEVQVTASAADATVDDSGDNDPPMATPDRASEPIPKEERDTSTEGEEFSPRPGIRQQRTKITARTTSPSPAPQVLKPSKKGRARAAQGSSSRQQTGGDLVFSEEDRETTLTLTPTESHHARNGGDDTAVRDDDGAGTTAAANSTKAEPLSKGEKRRAREVAKKAHENEAKSGCAVSFVDSIRARLPPFFFFFVSRTAPVSPGSFALFWSFLRLILTYGSSSSSKHSATFAGRRSKAGRNCSNTSAAKAMHWQIRVLAGTRRKERERRRSRPE
jgi:DnaJ family protein A protein 5